MGYRNLEGAYRIYPKKKKEEPISTIDEYQKAFLEGLEAYETKQKKPVRWNFLTDNEGLFQITRAISPQMQLEEGIHKLLTGKKHPTEVIADKFKEKINERDYVEGFADIAKGIETGKYELSLSIGELLFMGTDSIGNTNFQRDFQKMMAKQKPEEPETWRGDLASLMVQYGAPGTFIAKIMTRAKFLQPIVNALSKTKLHKASKIAQRTVTAMATVGATDALISPDQRRIGTMFKFAEPEKTSHLSGRKRAAAMFRNRIRYGVEGSLVGKFFTLGGKGCNSFTSMPEDQ